MFTRVNNNEINYFPTQEIFKVDIKTKQEKFENLTSLVNSKLGFTMDIKKREFEVFKNAMAFLVEACIQSHGEQWEPMFDRIVGRIKELEPAEAAYFIHKQITELYISSLQLKMLVDKNPEVDYQDCLEFYNDIMHSETEKNYREHQPVFFGGVSRELLPRWYKKIYIEPGPDNTEDFNVNGANLLQEANK